MDETGAKHTDVCLEYLAGFLDGEGCFHISLRCTYLEAQNTYFTVLNDIHKKYGGTLHGPYTYKRNVKPYWRWCVRGTAAKRLCAELLPYLREKRQQAAYIIEWVDAIPRGEKRKLLARLSKQAKKTQHDTHATD